MLTSEFEADQTPRNTRPGAGGRAALRGFRVRWHAWARFRNDGLLMLSLALLMVTVLGGCAGAGVGDRQTLVFNRMPEADEINLNVNVFRGNVRVLVDPAADGVVVQSRTRNRVDYRVRPGDTGSPESMQRASEDIAIVGEIVRDGQTGAEAPQLGKRAKVADLVVDVSTRYSRDDLQWVDLDIVTPPVDRLHVETSDGHLIIEGVDGGVTATTSEGSLVVQTDRSITGPVRLTNTNGDIHFNVSPNWRGEIDAIAVGGETVLFAPDSNMRVIQQGDNRMQIKLPDGPDSLVTERGRLVNAPIPVTLQATRGDVRVVVDDTPLRNLVTLRWWP